MRKFIFICLKIPTIKNISDNQFAPILHQTKLSWVKK